VHITGLTLRDFRNYERAYVELAPGLTVVAGPNAAGKTNLLEALYFGCTARSFRTSNERELVRRGSDVTRVTVATADAISGAHLLEVGFTPGEPKALRVDGAPADSLSSAPARPLLGVFLPDRLTLVKGAPAARRAHLDQLVAALWPARAGTRGAYGRALAQRNALLARLRGRGGTSSALRPWDTELARQGAQLMADRHAASDLLSPLYAHRARELGLTGEGRLRYRPRSTAADAAGLAAELGERHQADLERGFTAHGPHRDDIHLLDDETMLRSYGSQGQQRIALLALLFAERDLLTAERGQPPVMLLDDVMSELDANRRELLAQLLCTAGQSVLTSTEPDYLPGVRDGDAAVLEVAEGTLVSKRGGPSAASPRSAPTPAPASLREQQAGRA